MRPGAALIGLLVLVLVSACGSEKSGERGSLSGNRPPPGKPSPAGTPIPFHSSQTVANIGVDKKLIENFQAENLRERADADLTQMCFQIKGPAQMEKEVFYSHHACANKGILNPGAKALGTLALHGYTPNIDSPRIYSIKRFGKIVGIVELTWTGKPKLSLSRLELKQLCTGLYKTHCTVEFKNKRLVGIK